MQYVENYSIAIKNCTMIIDENKSRAHFKIKNYTQPHSIKHYKNQVFIILKNSKQVLT